METGQQAPAEGLPLNAAFVLQLDANADIALDVVTGRAEHVLTGRATRFTSVEELVGFIGEVLASVRGTHG